MNFLRGNISSFQQTLRLIENVLSLPKLILSKKASHDLLDDVYVTILTGNTIFTKVQSSLNVDTGKYLKLFPKQSRSINIHRLNYLHN